MSVSNINNEQPARLPDNHPQVLNAAQPAAPAENELPENERQVVVREVSNRDRMLVDSLLAIRTNS